MKKNHYLRMLQESIEEFDNSKSTFDGMTSIDKGTTYVGPVEDVIGYNGNEKLQSHKKVNDVVSILERMYMHEDSDSDEIFGGNGNENMAGMGPTETLDNSPADEPGDDIEDINETGLQADDSADSPQSLDTIEEADDLISQMFEDDSFLLENIDEADPEEHPAQGKASSEDSSYGEVDVEDGTVPELGDENIEDTIADSDLDLNSEGEGDDIENTTPETDEDAEIQQELKEMLEQIDEESADEPEEELSDETEELENEIEADETDEEEDAQLESLIEQTAEEELSNDEETEEELENEIGADETEEELENEIEVDETEEELSDEEEDAQLESMLAEAEAEEAAEDENNEVGGEENPAIVARNTVEESIVERLIREMEEPILENEINKESFNDFDDLDDFLL